MDLETFNSKLPFKAGMLIFQWDYCNLIQKDNDEGKNTIINIPTGHGKTVALYYAMHSGKTIYTVPIRALADEKRKEIPEMFPEIQLLRDTGADREVRSEFDYINQDLIITTTERLLSILNTKIQHEVLKNVEYIIFDEIHLINDVSRGSAVEWVIMVLKRDYPHIHLIGLTATLSNYVEFSEWFGGSYFYIPSEDRLIPLTFFYGDPIPPQRRIADVRDRKFAQLIRWTYQFPEPFLIFLFNKSEIERFARKFAQLPENATLEEAMEKKVAWHHADLDESQKDEVIDNFMKGKVTHVFCSPTLAMGVNVPATNCMVFDISFWNDKAWEHELLEEPKVRQMYGRAGRKGFSEFGRVFFAGQKHEVDHALWCVNNPQPSNSQFGRIIVDKVLNMIVRKDARTIEEIYDIIKESFLYHQRKDFDMNIIEKALVLLLKYQFVIKLPNGVYKPKTRGMKTTQFYIPVYALIDTIKRLMEFKTIEGKVGIFDLYRIFLGNDEFLSTIPFNDDKDKKFVLASQSYFKSDSTYANIFVSSYDKDQNMHIPVEKRDNLLKVLALIFKDEIMGKKFKSYTQKSTLAKWRKDATGLISRLVDILDDQLEVVTGNKQLFKLTEQSLKYGTLDKKKLELFGIEGFGEKTIEKLLARKIYSKEQFFKLTPARLKSYKLGISQQRFDKLKAKYGFETKSTTPVLTDWF